MAISKTPVIAGAVAAVGLCSAVYGTFFYLASSHPHAKRSLAGGAEEPAAEFASGPLVHRTTQSSSKPSAGSGSGAQNSGSPSAQTQAFLDEQFPERVDAADLPIRPDLRRDNPAEYERQVRALNPDYAKVLDEEAASDKAKEREQRRLDQEAEQKRLAEERRLANQ